MEAKNLVSRRWAVARNALLASAAFAALAPAAAFAQDETSAGGPQIEEVIVTAQRREEKLQDVPVAVSAFTGEQLERRGIESSEDLTKITPGLSFAQTGYTPQPTIRGVGTRGVSAGEESTVSLYIDGIYQPYMTNGFFKLNSVERIEVLKGPQSTLYGRNSTGGAINVVTRAPADGFAAKVSASYGSFNETVGKIYVGGGNEVFGADISAVYYSADGYLHDIISNDDRGQQNDYVVRGKVRFQPNEFVTLTLSASHAQSEDYTANLGRPVNGNTIARRWIPTPLLPTGTYDIARGQDIPFKTLTDNIALIGEFEIGDMTLNVVSSYMRTKTKLYANDPSATAAPVFRSWTSADPSSTYNEVYLRSGEGRFEWIVGGVIFSDEAPYTDYRIYTWNGVNGPGSRFTFTQHENAVGTESSAIYGQVTFEFTEQLTVTVGVRYTDEEKWMKRINYMTGQVAGIVEAGDPDLPYLVPPTVFPNTLVKTQFTNTSPSINITYKFNEDYMVYAKAGSGFKSGIYSAGSSNQTPADPEEITQYELGIKSDPLPWLRVNASVYYSDYKGLQAVSRDPITLAPVLQNAANAVIQGFELEIYARPIDNLNINFGLALTDGEYESWPAAQVTFPATAVNPPAATPCMMGTGALIGGNRSVFCDLSGYPIQRQPETMVILGGDYTWDLEVGTLNLSANLSYQSEYAWEPSSRLIEPSRTLIDAELTWSSPDENMRLSLWAQNLTDEAYGQALSASGTSDLITMARPRTIGIRFAYDIN